MKIFFQKLFDKYEINEGRIVTYAYDIFNDNKCLNLFKEFALCNDSSLIPLREICINRTVTSIDDFSSISETINPNLENILLFKNKYNISVGFDIHILLFDAKEGLNLCSFLRDIRIDFINFIFDFPEISKEKINSLIVNIQTFCSDPLVRNTKICFKNFPFCFIPPHRFRLLYQGLIKELKGNVFYQRHIIEELEKKNLKYFRKCEKCRCKIICYASSDIGKFPDYEPFFSPKTQSTVVFVGGSVKDKNWGQDTDMVCLPPAEQGDMFMSILEGFQNILVIDGYFYKKFPCTTFEVMLALEKGINVFGSSSIGALRAVELADYGMEGIGYVYNYLKKQMVKPYHIVAQTYDENDNNLSTPLVSIIYFLECCLKDNLINEKDYKCCFNVADEIHFTDLSFKFLFNKLKGAEILSEAGFLKINDFFVLKGEGFFNIKEKDALSLIDSFKLILKARDKNYVKNKFNATKQKYLKVLYQKYLSNPDLTLPVNWNIAVRERNKNYPLSGRDNRELSIQETLGLAEEFFKDLHVIVADTTKYDSTSNIVINIFFIPFYFLERNVSSSTGNGDNFEEVLVSAYMELIERIPLYGFSSNFDYLKPDEKDVFPQKKFPQIYNWDVTDKEKDKLTQNRDYVQATNIITQKNVLIPKYIAFSMNSGSDGNAAGNSLAEAVLYGIYELIERDVCRIYESIAFKEKCALIIKKQDICDHRSKHLIEFFEDKGCELVFYNLLNIYDIPCVRCEVYDLNNKIKRHGGTAVRGDINSALFNAASEAYMGYIIDFMGIRDDKRSIFDFEKNLCFYFKREKSKLQDYFLYKNEKLKGVKFGSIVEEMNLIIEKLLQSGVEDIIVINNSPKDEFKLKSVKVVIPNLELVTVSPYKPSRLYEAKVKQTRFIISCLAG